MWHILAEQGSKSQHLTLPSLISSQQRRREKDDSLYAAESGNLCFPPCALLVGYRGEATGFHMVVFWSRMIFFSKNFLSSSVGPLISKNRFFLWLFLSVLVGLSRLPIPLEPFLGYMRGKCTTAQPWTHCCANSSGPKVPRQSLFHLYLSESSYTCFMYNMHGLQVHILEEREFCPVHLILKQEVTAIFWNFMNIKWVKVHKSLRTVLTHSKCSINTFHVTYSKN